MIKVDVISGFLGAGKTTLIKKIFTAKLGKEKIALIENEFGQIGIDGSFLKDSGINIKEINSGCICCSLVGNFEKSLKELIDTYSPERIIIEPSGVGKLSDIVGAIKNTGLDIQINILCTVVDGGKCQMYLKNFGEFYIDQIKEANTILISKTGKLTEEKVIDAYNKVREINEVAKIITTPLDDIDGDTLMENLEENVSLVDKLIEEMSKHPHHHHHHHEDGEECDDPECECHHHHEDEDEEHECCHHHHDHDDDDEEEHEHHHHHHHEDGEECDDPECECHHHHEDEDEEHECCHHHHDHDDDDEEEHEHHHHHHHEDGEECDDPECECHHHHHHHDADEVFGSWGTETPKSYTKQELDDILKQLCTDKFGVILRAKGILKAKDNADWYYFDLVAGDYEIRTGEKDVIGKLCVIGSKIDKEKIKELF